MTGSENKVPVWGTILTILGVIILCALGTWQLQRLQWKQDILDKLDNAYKANQNAALNPADMTKNDFMYGRVTGSLLAEKAILLGPRVRDGIVGEHLIVPLETNDGVLFVNLGWTDQTLDSQPLDIYKGQTLWLEGLARAPDWNSFTPDNIPQEDIWYKTNIEQIADTKSLANPLPYILYAERASVDFNGLFPNHKRWAPNNNHLQYAFFWFAMAAAMIGVYGLRFFYKRK